MSDDQNNWDEEGRDQGPNEGDGQGTPNADDEHPPAAWNNPAWNVDPAFLAAWRTLAAMMAMMGFGSGQPSDVQLVLAPMQR
jgi:hypothetical protein